MRILHVMLSEGQGGIQAAFVNYTKLLVYLGHEVTCCVSPGAALDAQLPPRARVVTLTNWFERDPLAIFRAARLLRSCKPDVIVGHGKRVLMIFAQGRRFAGRAIPLVTVLHRHRFKHVNVADLVLCVSERMRAEAAGHGIDAHKLKHVPNFITELAPMAGLTPWRSPPMIGFLGRFLPEKGLDLLIEALAIMKSNGVAFQARIGGDGPQRAAMEKFAVACGVAGHIAWLGWVNDVSAFYKSVDILCVPSHWESFGIVILNAFDAGVPVVATRTTGPSELIADGMNGLLAEVNAHSLAAKLTQALKNPDLGGKLARQARADVAGYTLPVIAPKVDALLAGLVASFKRDQPNAANGVAN